MEDQNQHTVPPHPEQDDSNLNDFPEDDEKTLPTEEHLEALQAMDAMPSSQDTDIIDPGPSSQLDGPPVTPPSPYTAVKELSQTKGADNESWQERLRIAEESGDYDKITETYESLLEVFPNTVSCIVLATFSFLRRPFFVSRPHRSHTLNMSSTLRTQTSTLSSRVCSTASLRPHLSLICGSSIWHM